MNLFWLIVPTLLFAHPSMPGMDMGETGPAVGQRGPSAGPADPCGRVTDLDYFNEKRPACDAASPLPTPLGKFSNVKETAAHGDGLLPELRAVVPVDLTLCRKDGKDLLWFSAGIANIGDGALQIRPGARASRRPKETAWIEQDQLTDLRDAVQWIVNAKGQVVRKAVVGVFGWHAIHNHYHTDAMALYEVRRGGPDGELVSRGRKISFCLDDSYAHETAGVKLSERHFDQYCRYPQGVDPGWADEYPYAVAGQYVDVTGKPEGDYYLVVTVNPDHTVLQKTNASSTAWARFSLKRPKDGLPTVDADKEHSVCDGPGLCGELSPEKREEIFFGGGAPPKTHEQRLQLLERLGFCD